MTVKKDNPYIALKRLREMLDELFMRQHFGSKRWCKGDEETLVPAVDIIEDAEEFRLEMELPGFAKDEVAITLQGNQLLIFGQRKRTALSDKEGRFLRAERQHGVFSRRFNIPSSVDADAVTAKLKHGILTVRMPKTSKDSEQHKDVVLD